LGDRRRGGRAAILGGEEIGVDGGYGPAGLLRPKLSERSPLRSTR
jgi:hypothetical protein